MHAQFFKAEELDGAPPDPLVYISYNTKDWDLVSYIADRLRDHGVRVWVDKQDLEPGRDWRVEIEKARNRSSLWLLCMGPHGSDPSHAKEMEQANERLGKDPGFRVLPIVLPGAQPPFPQMFRRLYRIELHFSTLNDEEAYRRLLRSIEGVPTTGKVRGTDLEQPEGAPDPKYVALVSDPAALAKFFARLALFNTAATRLAEAPDCAVLSDVLRTCGLRTNRDVLGLASRFQTEPPMCDFEPNALWLSWFTTAKADKLEDIKRDLMRLPDEEARPSKPHTRETSEFTNVYKKPYLAGPASQDE